jgi:hypothetical protein
MVAPVKLQDVPAKFFDTKTWGRLRTSASSELLALCYLNTPYPNPVDQSDLLCARNRPLEQAVELYWIGRRLLNDYRLLLFNRKHTATGVEPDGKHVEIPSVAWFNLWPLFATGRANGPAGIFERIEIYETDRHKLEQDCVTWLTTCSEILTKKKFTVYQEAKSELGDELSHAIFNAAYKEVLGRKRGRPRKKNGASIKK